MAKVCPGCGCRLEGGLRVAACGRPDCCCRQIATRAGLERMAGEVRASLEGRDLEGFRALLADDVRWGGDVMPNRCRNRSQVVDTFRRQLAGGLQGRVSSLEIGPAGILCRLTVTFPAEKAGAKTRELFHLYHVSGERITEIEPFVDRRPALAALGSGPAA